MFFVDKTEKLQEINGNQVNTRKPPGGKVAISTTLKGGHFFNS